MKDSTKQGAFQAVSFFGICTIMCGAAIGLLISSGWLVLLADEGRNKIFLLPILVLLVATYFIYKKYKHGKAINIILYFGMSILLSALFMLYVFIPWWLPDYQGGPLLP